MLSVLGKYLIARVCSYDNYGVKDDNSDSKDVDHIEEKTMITKTCITFCNYR